MKFSALGSIVGQHMYKTLKHLLQLGKFLENETLQADSVVSNVRNLESYLRNLLVSDFRKPVKNFIAQVLNFRKQEKQFRTIPQILLAAALINLNRSARQCYNHTKSNLELTSLRLWTNQISKKRRMMKDVILVPIYLKQFQNGNCRSN